MIRFIGNILGAFGILILGAILGVTMLVLLEYALGVDEWISTVVMLAVVIVPFWLREIHLNRQMRRNWEDLQPDMVHFCRLSDRAEMAYPLWKGNR